MPNLVQTLENNPAIIHGGPFANIAHGCNSVIATKTSLELSDYVVTEAGFGADLGAEKFLNIKCRKADIKPSAVVLVATIRALKMHGGVAKADLSNENIKAVKLGMSNLKKHVLNMQKFGLPVIVAINHFIADTNDELKTLQDECENIGVEAIPCYHWAKGGEGTTELAKKVVEIAEKPNDFQLLYKNNIPLFDKIKKIAKEIYSADKVLADSKILNQLKQFEESGYGDFPICIAKTQYSFSTDPNLKGAPLNHHIPIREVRLSSGAEFIVVVCGEIMTMPGLPSIPAANSIKLNDDGEIEGLF
jgi:formate--tetrahydrofolate ligase